MYYSSKGSEELFKKFGEIKARLDKLGKIVSDPKDITKSDLTFFESEMNNVRIEADNLSFDVVNFISTQVIKEGEPKRRWL